MNCTCCAAFDSGQRWLCFSCVAAFVSNFGLDFRGDFTEALQLKLMALC